MSSFKRKTPANATPALPGTITCAGSPQTTLISTGIPSLDDILGGGLPLTSIFLISAPDPHSSYGDLVLKYGLSQGLLSGHDLCVISDNGKELVEQSMWLSASVAPISSIAKQDTKEDTENKIKIAWRYEQMKQFKTTITSTSSAEEDYCCTTFDLTRLIPSPQIDSAVQSGQLSFIEPCEGFEDAPFRAQTLLKRIENLVQESASKTPVVPLRICIPDFATASWGDATGLKVATFMHALRHLMRRFPHACATVVYRSSLFPGVENWSQKLNWVVDASITLSAFSGDLALIAGFPAYNGFLRMHKLPALHTLSIPSDKTSALRFGEGSGAGGENNLAFKCTRKRMVFETLHLDVEGGVGERRTKPAVHLSESGGENPLRLESTEKSPMPAENGSRVDVQLEGVSSDLAGSGSPEKTKKVKKKVVFHSDRPDVYDF